MLQPMQLTSVRKKKNSMTDNPPTPPPPPRLNLTLEIRAQVKIKKCSKNYG